MSLKLQCYLIKNKVLKLQLIYGYFIILTVIAQKMVTYCVKSLLTNRNSEILFYLKFYLVQIEQKYFFINEEIDEVIFQLK